jgi:hypothetical protein
MTMLLERSIDITLSEQPPEPATAEAVIVPLNTTESLVAARGLGKHIEVLYNSVRKNSDAERALLSVYELINDDIEDYRIKAMNLSAVLNPERSQRVPREQAALAITYLMVGQKAHRTGVWLKGKAREEKLIGNFKEVMKSDELTFFELNEWAMKQTVMNDRFWRQELQAVRTNPLIIELREAIETSDHQIEV